MATVHAAGGAAAPALDGLDPALRARVTDAPSRRVAAKCGYRAVARAAHKGTDTVVSERGAA